MSHLLNIVYLITLRHKQELLRRIKKKYRIVGCWRSANVKYLYFRKILHPRFVVFPFLCKKLGYTGRLTLCNLIVMLAMSFKIKKRT